MVQWPTNGPAPLTGLLNYHTAIVSKPETNKLRQFCQYLFQTVAANQGINAMPTFQMFKNGEKVVVSGLSVLVSKFCLMRLFFKHAKPQCSHCSHSPFD